MESLLSRSRNRVSQTFFVRVTPRAIDYCRLQQRSAASEQNKERSATSYAQPLVLCPKRRCQARKLSILRFESRPPDLGIYRLEVTPEGAVSAVTLLKSANRMMDVISMKTLVRWRAKSGPPRVIDVFISFGSRWLGPGSPMHPPG